MPGGRPKGGEIIPDAHVPTVPTGDTLKGLQSILEEGPVKNLVQRRARDKFKEYIAKEYMFWKDEDDLYVKVLFIHVITCELLL